MPNLEAIEVYNALKERLGEEPTRALLKYIEEAARANVATKEDLLLTRDELKDENVLLRQDLMKVRDELKDENVLLRQDLMKFRDELKDEDATLRQVLIKVRDELKGDIAVLRQDLVAVDKRVGESDVKIERNRVELTEESAKTRLYVVTVAVIVVLTNPKILEILGKAITFLR